MTPSSSADESLQHREHHVTNEGLPHPVIINKEKDSAPLSTEGFVDEEEPEDEPKENKMHTCQPCVVKGAYPV